MSGLMLWRTLALEGARRAVEYPYSRALDRLDPAGKSALETALSNRRALRRMMRTGADSDAVEAAYRLAMARAETVDIAIFEIQEAGQGERGGRVDQE